MSPLPRGARPFVDFAALLRRHGFFVAPEQTEGFIAGVGLLGPRSMADVYRAARATLAPGPDRLDAFDALYRHHFLGQGLEGSAADDGDDETRITEARDGAAPPPETGDEDEVGAVPSPAERLGGRHFAPDAPLGRFRREAPGRLARRVGYRRRRARAGDGRDLRAALRAAVRYDGEVLTLPRTRRRRRQRRVLLLIDVSGSMKAQTGAALRFAHAMCRAAERIEVFTLGTRLTRVTRPLTLAHPAQALDRAASLVADWDGGTRLGDALTAYLNLPRYAGFARGAHVLVLSDGLERGDPTVLVEAVRGLSRLAWRLDWLTPLAGDPGFAPRTEAVRLILPHLNRLAPGGGLDALCAHILEPRRNR